MERNNMLFIQPDAMLGALLTMARRNRKTDVDTNTNAGKQHKHVQKKTERNAKDKHNKKGILARMCAGSGGPGATWERGLD